MQDFSDNFFDYNGKKYALIATLYTIDKDDANRLESSLKTSNIISFTYMTEFNKLFIEGEIIYQDNNAVVDKFLECPICYSTIQFGEIIQKFDGEITVPGMSDTQKFLHNFIVNGIKILNRQNHIITYKISLVGVEWLNCVKTIHYSNYDRGPEQIYDIIKGMISAHGLSIDKKSFDLANSDVEINYITNGNDNAITAIKYLQSRLFYYDRKDSSLKFIVLDDSTGIYHLFSFTDPETSLGSSTIILSLFKNNTEKTTQEEPNELNCVVKQPRINSYEALFATDFYTFDYNNNEFGNDNIATTNITSYKNEHFETTGYENKYKFFNNDEDFRKKNSFWNNNLNIYQTISKSLVEDSALVINSVGDLSRKPGCFLTVNVDRDIKDIEDDSIEKMDEIKNKYKSLEGLWVISRVRHIIIPSMLQSPKIKYRQNLVLIRNFVRSKE